MIVNLKMTRGMSFLNKLLAANMVSLAAVIGATVMAFMLIGLVTTNCN